MGANGWKVYFSHMRVEAGGVAEEGFGRCRWARASLFFFLLSTSRSPRPHDGDGRQIRGGAAEAQMVTGGLRRGWSRAEGKTGGDGGLRATVVGSRGAASQGSDLTSSGLGTRRGAQVG